MGSLRRPARRRLDRIALWALVGLLLGPAGAGLAAGAEGHGRAAASGITLTASPTRGPAPLEVAFVLTLPAGAEPMLRWSFGDGATLNGSNASDLRPVHLYRTAGTFTCLVVAEYPAGPVNSSLVLAVLPSAPSVSVSASPSSGPVPLTVWLNGTVQGGSGTYLAYLWNFGNGQSGSGPSVQYTYPTAGTYQANLTVVDSDNVSGTGSVLVRVTPVPGKGEGAPGPAGPVSLTDAVVAAILLAVVALVALLVVRTRRGRLRDRLAPEGTPPAPGGPPEAPGGNAPATVAGPAPPSPAPGSGSAASPARPVPDGVANPARLTHQLLRHLAGLPRLLPGELATRAYTQAGMAEVLGAGQSAVSRVLRRLVAAGVVTAETRHVRDGDRRVRVYLLTDRGERLGRALREMPSVPVEGPGAPPDP